MTSLLWILGCAQSSMEPTEALMSVEMEASEEEAKMRSEAPPSPGALEGLMDSKATKSLGEEAGSSSPDGARSWFPETFLWLPELISEGEEPLSQTVRLPDSLSTWRLVALASSREGQQAGAELLVTTQLEEYVETRPPEQLMLGDSLLLPVTVVNQTQRTLTAEVRGRSSGGLQGELTEKIKVPAKSTRSLEWELETRRPGVARLSLGLKGRDRVEHTLEVLPRGEPVVLRKSGLAGAPAVVDLDLVKGARHARLELELHRGWEELLVSQARGLQPARHPELSYLLGRVAPELLGESGADRAEPWRRLRQEALQVLHAQRGVGLELSAPGSTLEEHLEDLLILRSLGVSQEGGGAELHRATRGRLRSLQRPDGSWALRDGTPLNLALLWSSELALALGDQQTLHATQGLLARHRDYLMSDRCDPYTLAAVMRVPGMESELRESLSERLYAMVGEDEQGRAVISASRPGLRIDGQAPSEIELLAMTRVALPERRELLESLMLKLSESEPQRDLLSLLSALEAVATSAERSLSEEGRLQVSLGGEERATLLADPDGHRWTWMDQKPAGGELSLTPEGLSESDQWSLSWIQWRAWPEASAEGLRAEIDAEAITQWRPFRLTLKLQGITGSSARIDWRLPAGWEAQTSQSSDSAELILWSGGLSGELQLDSKGQAEVELMVTARYAGRLWSGPLHLSSGGERVTRPPEPWRVRAD